MKGRSFIITVNQFGGKQKLINESERDVIGIKIKTGGWKSDFESYYTNLPTLLNTQKGG